MGAGLFLRTLMNLRNVDLGFVPERLIVLNVNPQAAGYEAETAVAVTQQIAGTYQDDAGHHGRQLRGERRVVRTRQRHRFDSASRDFLVADSYPRARWDVVGPAYSRRWGFTWLRGATSPNGRRIVAAGHRHQRDDGAAVAFRARILSDDAWCGAMTNITDFEIVAVARDVKQGSPRDEPQLRFYLPYRQLSVTRPSWILASVQFIVRTTADAAAMLPVLHRAVAEEDARLTVREVYVAHELIDRVLVQERMIAKLSIAFGVLAVGLACIGLYGLISYQVVQRTGEIGIRMALGAQRTQVLWATLRRALIWTPAGIALGTPLALTASRSAEGLLFGLSPMDVMTLICSGRRHADARRARGMHSCPACITRRPARSAEVRVTKNEER